MARDDTIDRTETPRSGTAHSTPILGIVLGIVGTVLMSYSFVNGIAAALDAGGDGPGLYIALFLGGAALVLIAIIIGIVGLVRGGHRILSFLSLLIGLVPAAVIVVLVVVNLSAIGAVRP